MLNQFLAVSTLVLSIVYFTLVSASSKGWPPVEKLSPDRRAKISTEISKIKPQAKSLKQGNCYDIKTDPLSPIDQMVLQIPKQTAAKDFEVYVSAFKGDEKIWLNNYKCKKDDQALALCVSEDGTGNFKLDWSQEKTDLVIRTITFGNYDHPGPILSPKDGTATLQMRGEAISCG